MGGSISLFPWSLDAARGIRRRYYFQGRAGRIRPVPQSGDTHSSGKGGDERGIAFLVAGALNWRPISLSFSTALTDVKQYYRAGQVVLDCFVEALWSKT